MYNFFVSVLNKNIYLDFADKIDNIVKKGLDKIDTESYEKYDFSKLLIERKYSLYNLSIQDYISFFNPKNEEKFNEIVSYTANNFVQIKQEASIEYDYIVSNMNYVVENYSIIINNIDKNLDSFKFFELNSVDQSILLLGISEFNISQTPKAVIIKECLFLASTFTSDSSLKLINAVLDKVIPN